jgi:hypothetical protein
MNTPQKLIYGVLDGIIYAASGPAMLRSIAAHVLISDETFTMGQLRGWVGPQMAENLVLREEDDEDLASDSVQTPIADEIMLTHNDISEDQIEDYTWIENAMREELPGSVLALGAPPSYRSGLGIVEEQLPEFERLLQEAGFDIIRDDALIALIEDDDVNVELLTKAKAALTAHLGDWEDLTDGDDEA